MTHDAHIHTWAHTRVRARGSRSLKWPSIKNQSQVAHTHVAHKHISSRGNTAATAALAALAALAAAAVACVSMHGYGGHPPNCARVRCFRCVLWPKVTIALKRDVSLDSTSSYFSLAFRLVEHIICSQVSTQHTHKEVRSHLVDYTNRAVMCVNFHLIQTTSAFINIVGNNNQTSGQVFSWLGII